MRKEGWDCHHRFAGLLRLHRIVGFILLERVSERSLATSLLGRWIWSLTSWIALGV